mmetsp:Transcript_68982/g.108783  ORF Transcript_68982/g.108783 Transcript_68982/m.108783 type:complete len:233 (+) Transcript_68982:1070-1768(+)
MTTIHGEQRRDIQLLLLLLCWAKTLIRLRKALLSLDLGQALDHHGRWRISFLRELPEVRMTGHQAVWRDHVAISGLQPAEVYFSFQLFLQLLLLPLPLLKLLQSHAFPGFFASAFLVRQALTEIALGLRRHLGSGEHDRGETFGLNSEGEARGSLLQPWQRKHLPLLQFSNLQHGPGLPLALLHFTQGQDLQRPVQDEMRPTLHLAAAQDHLIAVREVFAATQAPEGSLDVG